MLKIKINVLDVSAVLPVELCQKRFVETTLVAIYPVIAKHVPCDWRVNPMLHTSHLPEPFFVQLLQNGAHAAHIPDPFSIGPRKVVLHRVHCVSVRHFAQPVFVLHKTHLVWSVRLGVPNPGRQRMHLLGAPGTHVRQSSN